MSLEGVRYGTRNDISVLLKVMKFALKMMSFVLKG